MPFVLPTHNQVSWGTWLRIWPFLPFVSDFAYKLDRSQSLFSSRTSGKDIWLPRPQQWTKNSDKFPWAIELLCHQFGRFFAVSDPPSLWKIDSPGFFQPQGGCHSISRLWISQWSRLGYYKQTFKFVFNYKTNDYYDWVCGLLWIWRGRHLF